MTRALLILGILLLLASGALLARSGPAVEPLTEDDCPSGARIVGAAPPEGHLQRCMRGGVRHGPSRGWYEGGRVRFETQWWDGKKHGRFSLWYENGRKRAEGQDRHGVPAGTWTSWDEEGRVVQQRTFEPGDG
jgi:hypothetical protein